MRKLVLLLVLCLSASPSAGQSTLDHEIRGIISKYHIPASGAGILARAPGGATTYYALHPDTPRMPASNMKLWTTSAALDALGPDYQYSTYLTTVGRVKDGTLEGHLWVTGRGDPTISDRFEGDRFATMKEWAEDLKRLGIRHVTGCVVGDDDYFDDVMRNPAWKKAHYMEWYGAPISELSYNDNCLLVHWKPGKRVNAPALYAFEPDVGAMTLVNHVKTSSSRRRDGRWYLPHVGDVTAEALGTVRITRKGDLADWVPVDNPTQFFAATFRAVLINKGITVDGPGVDQDDAKIKVASGTPLRRVAVYKSPTLAEIVKVTNRRSQNFYAEMIFKTLGRVKAGTGTCAAARKVVLDFMKRWKIPTKGFHQQDGSGLATENQVTPRQIVDLLDVMDKHPASPVFWDSLPVGGERGGSLHHRFQRTRRERALAPHISAKTGSINKVRALSGVCRPEEREPVFFSILLNDIPGSGYAGIPAIDEIVMALAEHAERR